MKIVAANHHRAKKINSRLLKEMIKALLADLKIEDAELGVNLVAVKEIAVINETFLRHEGCTDVITFNYLDSPGAGSKSVNKQALEPARAGSRNFIRGEIFICVDEAISQSKKFKTSWQSEIVRYLIHGVLHLVGHDDCQPAARRKMKREENRRLRELSRRFALRKL